eukprot:354085-Chlamydomonas_euryale.AAC.3
MEDAVLRCPQRQQRHRMRVCFKSGNGRRGGGPKTGCWGASQGAVAAAHNVISGGWAGGRHGKGGGDGRDCKHPV